MKGKIRPKKDIDPATLGELWSRLQGTIIALDEKHTPEEVMARIMNNPHLTRGLEEDFDGTAKEGMAFQHRYITSQLYAVVLALAETLGLPTEPGFAEPAELALSWLVTMSKAQTLAERRMIEDLWGPGATVAPEPPAGGPAGLPEG